MAMTVSYSVVPRKNPAKKSEPAKYYAQAQASGEFRSCAKRSPVVLLVRKRMYVRLFRVFFTK